MLHQFHLFIHEDDKCKNHSFPTLKDQTTYMIEKAIEMSTKIKSEELKEVFKNDLEKEFEPSKIKAEVFGPSNHAGPASIFQIKVSYRDIEKRRWWEYFITVTFIKHGPK